MPHSNSREWYVLLQDGKKKGPYSVHELIDCYKHQEITSETLVLKLGGEPMNLTELLKSQSDPVYSLFEALQGLRDRNLNFYAEEAAPENPISETPVIHFQTKEGIYFLRSPWIWMGGLFTLSVVGGLFFYGLYSAHQQGPGAPEHALGQQTKPQQVADEALTSTPLPQLTSTPWASPSLKFSRDISEPPEPSLLSNDNLSQEFSRGPAADDVPIEESIAALNSEFGPDPGASPTSLEETALDNAADSSSSEHFDANLPPGPNPASLNPPALQYDPLEGPFDAPSPDLPPPEPTEQPAQPT